MGDEAKLRKQQDTLATGGFGVMLLSLWTILKFTVLMTVSANEMITVEEAEGLPEWAVFLVVFVVIFVIILAVVVFHLYIGIKAVSESRGQSGGIAYVVICAGMVLFNVIGICMYFSGNDTVTDADQDTKASSFLLDITALLIYSQLFWSAVQVKILKKRIAQKGNE